MESFKLEQRNRAVVSEIRAAMARKGVKPIAVAPVVGIGRTGLYRRLNGETPFSVDELIRLADYLGVPPSSFFPKERAA